MCNSHYFPPYFSAAKVSSTPVLLRLDFLGRGEFLSGERVEYSLFPIGTNGSLKVALGVLGVVRESGRESVRRLGLGCTICIVVPCHEVSSFPLNDQAY